MITDINEACFEYIKTPDGLRDLREHAELTQAELAELTEIAQPNLAAMERGKRKISTKTAQRILDALEWYFREPTEEERQASREAAERAVAAVFARHEEAQHV